MKPIPHFPWKILAIRLSNIVRSQSETPMSKARTGLMQWFIQNRNNAWRLSRIHISLAALLMAGSCGASAQISPPQNGVIAKWDFSSLPRHLLLEQVSGAQQRIEGIFLPVAGPTGPGLEMDGYTTVIRGKPLSALQSTDAFSITCWIKVNAYPWNNVPILDQQDREQSTFFGLDAEGHLLARVHHGQIESRSRSNEAVPLRRWILATMTASQNGSIQFFLDNTLTAAGNWPAEPGQSKPHEKADADTILIGRVRSPLLPEPTQFIHPFLPVHYSLQGSLSGLTIYNKVLSSAEVGSLFRKADPKTLTPTPPPSFPKPEHSLGAFGAFYTTLHYDPIWDAGRRIGPDSDVVVRFPQSPIRLVFWQGTNYIPAWTTENNRWYTDEFMEVSADNQRCPDGEDCEPISDRQSRYSHVRILESTPARAVIDWRYAPSEVEYYKIADSPSPTEWGDWANEYWYVYPDGVAVRKQVLWSTAPQRKDTEFQETIVLIPPGETPEDNIHYDALTLANVHGETRTYSWQPKTTSGLVLPKGPNKTPGPPQAVIQWVNLKSAWKPFQVAWGPSPWIEPYYGERSISAFEWWNHFPVTQIPSSGRPALAADRAGHSSLSHIYWPTYQETSCCLVQILMDGLTQLPARELGGLAASWRTAAKADVDSGASIAYDPSQRAYVITTHSVKTLGITLDGSPATPVYHPAFVVDHWSGKARVSVNGKPPSSPADIGYVQTLAGEKLVIFLPVSSESKLTITISPEA